MGSGQPWELRLTCPPSRPWAEPLDQRTDLFSFGIVLYEMCTGQSPFSGDTTGELLISIVQQVPVMPAQLNPDLPAGLAGIIELCLEKNPEYRYQHASEIHADLKRLQRDSAAEIAPPSGSRIDATKHVVSTSLKVEGAFGAKKSAETSSRTRTDSPSFPPTLGSRSRGGNGHRRRGSDLLLDAPRAAAAGFKLHPAHTRRRGKISGRHRWFEALPGPRAVPPV